jgi:protein RecA
MKGKVMAGKRERLEEPKEEPKGNIYFLSEKKDVDFLSSGCTLLDCVLNGGYPLGRMVNIVGDKSTSKTALGTEAMINFLKKYPDSKPAYRETEGAWDDAYAEAMGLPLDQVDFGDREDPVITVEGFARDLEKYLDKHIKSGEQGMYVLDSFDALSDEAEQEQDIGKGTYGMAKAKTASILFRKLTKKLEKSKCLLIIISQIRENIGVSFGEKYRRAGGKALDFYASQILWLAHTGKLKRTVKGMERTYGISIKATCKKNKAGAAFRECEFDFIFAYGVDDVTANLDFLKKAKRLDLVKVISQIELSAVTDKNLKEFKASLDDLSDKMFGRQASRIAEATKEAWRDIEGDFLPKRRKYA